MNESDAIGLLLVQLRFFREKGCAGGAGAQSVFGHDGLLTRKPLSAATTTAHCPEEAAPLLEPRRRVAVPIPLLAVLAHGVGLPLVAVLHPAVSPEVAAQSLSH
jgi:hypothetical protein